MKIIAVSGGIASGKNFICEILSHKTSATVFDADKEVHDIFKNNKTIISKIKNYFPKSYVGEEIDRKILSKIIFREPKKLKILEEIIHPQIRKNYQNFLTKAKEEKRKFVILNIPLLLENGGYSYDKLIAIVIYPSVQKKRFISRARQNGIKDIGFLEKKFEEITNRQFNNSQRKENADFVVNTSFSKKKTKMQITKIASLLST